MLTKLILSLALSFTSCVIYAESTNLSYQYVVPYSGGGQLVIKNNGTQPAVISSLKFTSNATLSGVPWGTLWGWQSNINASPNEDGIHIDYVISEKPAITIAPSSEATLIYNVNTQKIGGPFAPYNAVMDPTVVLITLADSTSSVSVPIDGKCQDSACDDPGHGKRIMGYYPDWSYWHDPKFLAEQLPFDKMNAVAYAFSIMDENGNVSLYDPDSDAVNLPAISQARKKYPYLNASLSFGGWSWASTPPGWQCAVGASPEGPAACFSRMTADETATAQFVDKAVKAMKSVNFNGIDIDWEYPAVSDAGNYVNLLQQLRVALDKEGVRDNTHYYLTIAVAAGWDKINQITPEQWQLIAKSVDYIDVMTYDFHGSWDQGQTGSNFLSAMALDPTLDATFNDPVLSKYNVIDAMNVYVDMGIPKSKLVIGLPLYGRMMSIEQQGPYNGLYQPITGTPQGEWDNQQSGFTGMIDYACIVDRSSCGNGYNLPNLMLVDPTVNPLGQYSKTPWGYAANLFVTYDDNKSAAYKTKWALDNQFAGVMLWEFTGDFPDTDERSIVNAVYQMFQSVIK
ncbi:MAG: glycoside hydrolase family 18 protein [Legionellaceae bacterium]|nr:glycoside hydrolase family 18 protein [Legionellaceae bacterium]